MNPRLLPPLFASVLAVAVFPARANPVFSAGHADIGVGYEAGALHPHWHLHEGAVVNGAPLDSEAEYAPDGLLAYLSERSISRPVGAQWDFLGTPAGSPLWFLPQDEDPTKPFVGLASEELLPSDWSSLRLSLVQFSGPVGGEFSLWQADLFGNPVVRMATSDGLDAGDGFNLTVGGHDHFNYGFTQPGVYQATFRWDGVHVSDGPVNATGTYAFGVTVVPQPPTRLRLLRSHVDLAVTYQPADVTNKFAIVVSDEDLGRTYRSNEVAIVAVEAAKLTLPPGTVFGREGDPFWVLPQSQNPAVVYLGLSGAALPRGTFARDLDLRLLEVRGPGHFFLWQAGAFGEFDLRMSSADGISAADQVPVPPGGHAHYNWGFTTNGVYEVVLQTFGQRTGIATNDFSLPTAIRFEVEPLPPPEPDTPFAQWQRLQWPGVTNLAVIGPGADPDGDTLVNAVEYALGLDPKSPGRDGMPVATAAGTPPRATLRYSRPVTATDVRIVCWRASTLASSPWEQMPDPQVAPGLPGSDRLELTFDGGPVDPTRPVFLRLEVHLP